MDIQISQLIKSTGKYDLTIFSPESIDRIESSIFEKWEKYFLSCLKRKKDIQVKPEEIVRQLMLDKLSREYNYSLDLLEVEYSVSFGREKKFADIVILNKTDKTSVYCVIEIKKHSAKDGKDQLKSYCHATGAPLAIWTNGTEINYYERLNPNYFEPLLNVPKSDETIDDVKNEQFTYLDLIKKDKLRVERVSLEEVIKGLEDEVLANAWVDVFEEVFKLLFIKLYDEMMSFNDIQKILWKTDELRKDFPNLTEDEILEKVDDSNFRNLEFRSRWDAHRTKEVINELFKKAKERWTGIFEKWEPLRITDENHLQISIAYLQKIKIYNSNLLVIDKAFEYLINKSAKGEKWQYFTPRNVIDMCVYMMNPQAHENMIDTACGSCGFTVHTLANVWEKIKSGKHLFQAQFLWYELDSEQKDYVNNVFGIDFDEKSVRVARTLNMIAGDGKTNVLHLNTLDYTRWEERKKDDQWLENYNEWYQRLLKLAKNKQNPKEFNFDIVMANPPFAGDIKDSRLISEYEVAFDAKGKKANKVSRDVLFIERNLDFLKDGGRMAIVLPQWRFNNTSDGKIRDYIMDRARLLAVVGLNVNTFKPHTGTKTSALFIQKWDEDKKSPTYNPHVDDYEIFMAVSEESGKDNSGIETYEIDDKWDRKLDEHGHLIQKHDLNEIAFAFERWAKDQGLNFWNK